MRIEVTTNIDVPKVLKKIDNDAFWTYAASEWHRLYAGYVPYRNGDLYKNVTIRPKEIIHNVPYATDVYSHNRRYRTDFHDLATSKWDKQAAPTQGTKLVAAMQEYVNRGMK